MLVTETRDRANASEGFQPCFFDDVFDERFVNGYPISDRVGGPLVFEMSVASLDKQ
jgi:hypothetical protein